MKIHHLNCGTMCPNFKRLMDGSGGPFDKARFVCHCLLIETHDGLVLIDTGIGEYDIRTPGQLGPIMRYSCTPAYDLMETAIAQIKSLDLYPADVRHIVTTHLDLDHAGGLADFPNAAVHVHKTEHDEAMRRSSFNAKIRYIERQWSHDVTWKTYSELGEPWFGFDAVRTLKGVKDNILLIPLHGHSSGHCGVAVEDDTGHWWLHAGDAYFHRSQVAPSRPKVPIGISIFQNTMVFDRKARNNNVERLRELNTNHRDAVTVFCAHDSTTFDRLHDASKDARG